MKRLFPFLLVALAATAHAQCVVGPDAGTYPCTVTVPAQTVTVPAQTIQLQVTVTAASAPQPPDPPPVVKPLAKLANIGWEGNGLDVNYSGQTINGSDGDARVSTDMATGISTNRVKQGDTKIYSGMRSEFGWYGRMAMVPGNDYWFAFAFKPIAWAGGRQIFWQIHQMTGIAPGNSCNGPSLELQLANGALQINSVSGTATVWTCNSLLNSAVAAPAIGAWSRFVVHYRPGYLSSHAPVTQVWKDGVLVLDRKDMNTQPNANDYPKMGIYKWDDTWSGVTQRAAQYSPLFFGVGADLKANADAAVAGFK